MTDGTGVLDIGGVNVGETGIDRQVGTDRMLQFELLEGPSSPWSNVDAPEPNPSASSSAIG
jgi:hypothetical protein